MLHGVLRQQYHRKFYQCGSQASMRAEDNTICRPTVERVALQPDADARLHPDLAHGSAEIRVRDQGTKCEGPLLLCTSAQGSPQPQSHPSKRRCYQRIVPHPHEVPNPNNTVTVPNHSPGLWAPVTAVCTVDSARTLQLLVMSP